MANTFPSLATLDARKRSIFVIIRCFPWCPKIRSGDAIQLSSIFWAPELVVAVARQSGCRLLQLYLAGRDQTSADLESRVPALLATFLPLDFRLDGRDRTGVRQRLLSRSKRLSIGRDERQFSSMSFNTPPFVLQAFH